MSQFTMEIPNGDLFLRVLHSNTVININESRYYRKEYNAKRLIEKINELVSTVNF